MSATVTPIHESKAPIERSTLVYGVAAIADVLEHEIGFAGGFLGKQDGPGYRNPKETLTGLVCLLKSLTDQLRDGVLEETEGGGA